LKVKSAYQLLIVQQRNAALQTTLASIPSHKILYTPVLIS